MKLTKNSAALRSFAKYCQEHPEERFWQALRNWSGYDTIYAGSEGEIRDTFYWTKTGRAGHGG